VFWAVEFEGKLMHSFYLTSKSCAISECEVFAFLLLAISADTEPTIRTIGTFVAGQKDIITSRVFERPKSNLKGL
jgi:hypothetical protein